MFPPVEQVVAPPVGAPPEKPRLVFSFGPSEDSFFIGCGETMEWANLPEDLEHILRNRAHEVLALSLGEEDAFYCRYIAKNKTEYTVTGSLPPRLEFLLSCWWANQYEVPFISLGPSNSYFFQTSSMTAWQHLPKRLEESLLSLRDTASSTLPPRAVTLGAAGSHILLSGSNGESAFWHGIDAELAEKLGGLAGERLVETAVLSLGSTEDYILVFGDGSIFYSLPDPLLPVFQKFVKVYHEALIKYSAVVPGPYAGIAKREMEWVQQEEPVDVAMLAERPHQSPMSSPDSVPREMAPPPQQQRRPGRGTRGRRGVRGGQLWQECRDEWCSCRTQAYRGARGAA